ncbi:PREDICTED: ribosomal RNA processing protein 1 homolog isoform X2 [Dinoponera quadriceps]|uniref:Ribosomal RNA processing protein 1 homolog isoform X2 n=1 Tax=Dinoponera quadriceps TaxID=609295 RepID=A0A6P3Y3Y5_DINQU|nr:PREDICTED: ribosomal RNA processing protein 1 homolog isoform X2 [Dinoponera quadriceps]
MIDPSRICLKTARISLLVFFIYDWLIKCYSTYREIKFARLLADNDKRTRDKVLRNLQKWLTVRSQSSFAFTEMDFISLWKGLFYCMWMSDKMLVQEELAESLSKIVHCFNSKDTIMLYTACALKTLAIEWFGIDQYRLDKFSMLVRRILRQTFVVCKDKAWDMSWVKEISGILEKLFQCPQTNLGLSLHITEIYLEELAKIGDGDLPEEAVVELIRPFVVYLATTKDERQMKHIMKHIFRYLIFQSDVGIEYREKFEAWRDAGFPCTYLDNVKKVDVSDTEDDSENEDERPPEAEVLKHKAGKPLDPRAGRVDVELPQIPFNPAEIVKLLVNYKFYPQSTAKSRRQLARILEEYKELAEGRMPLGIRKVRNPVWQKADMDPKKAALRLIQFEKSLYSDKVNNKRKRDERTIKKDDANTDSNTEPPKKRRKSNLTRDKLDSKSELTENGEKPGTKSISKKSKTVKKIKLNGTNDAKTSNRNIGCETKAAALSKWQVSDRSADQCALPAPILPSSISAKKTPIKKPETAKTILENGISCKDQAVVKKNKPPNRTKQQTNLNNSATAKKKVKIVLNRNTEQHTSEYIQQVRKSPAIPFDANKKPLAGVLKANFIPSPVNPFYKKSLRN